MEFLDGVVAVPVIVGIVYCIMMLYKYVVGEFEKAISLIPVLSALLGGILGVVMFYTARETIPASDFFTALLIGMVSGWSATGINQTGKQLKNIVKPANQEEKLIKQEKTNPVEAEDPAAKQAQETEDEKK